MYFLRSLNQRLIESTHHDLIFLKPKHRHFGEIMDFARSFSLLSKSMHSAAEVNEKNLVNQRNLFNLSMVVCWNVPVFNSFFYNFALQAV